MVTLLVFSSLKWNRLQLKNVLILKSFITISCSLHQNQRTLQCFLKFSVQGCNFNTVYWLQPCPDIIKESGVFNAVSWTDYLYGSIKRDQETQAATINPHLFLLTLALFSHIRYTLARIYLASNTEKQLNSLIKNNLLSKPTRTMKLLNIPYYQARENNVTLKIFLIS